VGVLLTGQGLATIGKSNPAAKCSKSAGNRRRREGEMQRPWFRRQTWSWYVEVDGRQQNLGKHPFDEAPRKGKRGWSPPAEIAAAWLELGRACELKAAAPDSGPRQDMPVRELIHRFLAGVKGQIGQETGEGYAYYLRDFADRHPNLKVQDITRNLVRDWLAAHPPEAWGQSSHRAAITAIKRALNWGVESELLRHNPIAALKKPPAVRRRRVMSAEERPLILAMWPEGDPFHDFLVAAMETGCRPGEIMKVTAADVDLKEGVWRFPSKDYEKTGLLRVVYLTPTLLELTGRLMARHPVGPLFRNADGKPWRRRAIRNRFARKRARKKDPLAGDIVAYTCRHTYATDALANGVPVVEVAESIGHHSPGMVETTYKHMEAKADQLRRAAHRAVRNGSGPPMDPSRPPSSSGGESPPPPDGA
jgi:integrase